MMTVKIGSYVSIKKKSGKENNNGFREHNDQADTGR